MTTLLLMSMILWGYSLRLTRRLRKNRMLLAANALLGAILLWMFRYLSEQVQLPTSLLPAENILEFRYYAEELRQVIRGLEGFSAAAAGRTLEAFPVNLLLSGGILLAGIALISVHDLSGEESCNEWRRFRRLNGYRNVQAWSKNEGKSL